jgi:hypothetical protein
MVDNTFQEKLDRKALVDRLLQRHGELLCEKGPMIWLQRSDIDLLLDAAIALSTRTTPAAQRASKEGREDGI